ncbi:MAG: hypothetical protein ACOC44_16285 [Promethearchaeia archaeon]
MIKDGILKGADRKEQIWKKTTLGEPFKKSLETFRKNVMNRDDLDPTSLLQFGLFMSMGVLNILKDVENKFGKEGHEVVADALIKTGYDVGKQMVENAEIPKAIKPIELMSFLATIINTQAWTSIEDPRIENEKQCSFDILWCPLQDEYSAFDCRVQRYLVQGILNAFRDSEVLDKDYQIEFTQTIPAGASCCTFIINEKEPGEPDKWEGYSKKLKERALKRKK